MTAPNRVRYLSGQALDLSTLVDEQAYLSACRQRHNLECHGAGIVRGLTLRACPASEGEVEVLPGEGIDGTGRAISLISPISCVLSDGEGDADVWLTLDDEGGVKALSVPLSSAEEGAPVAPTNGDAPREDVLYVGRARHNADEIDNRWLRYAGVRAQTLHASTGNVFVYLGDGDSMSPVGGRLSVNGRDCLKVGNAGAAMEVADLGVVGGGALALDALVVQTQSAGDTPPDPSPVPSAHPWSLTSMPIVNAQPKEQSDAAGAGGGENVMPSSRLQIELPVAPQPGGVKRPARVCIGVSQNGVFSSHLDVEADGRVTVHGDLQVDGVIASAPTPVNPKDPTVASAIADAWTNGMNAANPDAGLRLSINGLSVDPVRRTIEATVVLKSAAAGSLSSMFAYRTVTCTGVVRQNRIWPDTPPSGSVDRGGRLTRGATKEIKDRVDFTPVEWPFGKTVQFSVHVTYVDENSKAGYVSAAASATIPSKTA